MVGAGEGAEAGYDVIKSWVRTRLRCVNMVAVVDLLTS